MDGVLADFDKAVLDALPAEIGRIARTSFYIDDDYPEHAERVHEITKHPEFFYKLPIIDGALEGWQRLLDLGYEPRICSAPLHRNPKSVEGKKAWLREHFVPVFGEQVVQRSIIDKQKYNYEGLVLIDDRPVMDTNNGQAKWQHVVFDRPYNQNSDAMLRLHGWQDPDLALILQIAQENALK